MALSTRRCAGLAGAALALFVAALIGPAAVPVAEAQCTVQFCATCPADPTCASCNPGFRLIGGTACNDINECATNNGGCAAQPSGSCTNTTGSHNCSCNTGYAGTGFVCNDINECATNGACNVGTCTNSAGTFTCECPAGVTGTTCDINGYVPPDKATAACAKGVSDNVAKYVKCLTRCRTQKASKALSGKDYDEQACASGPKGCRSVYDKKMLSLVENGTCPTCLDQTAQTGLADDALAAIIASRGAAYCEGTVPLAP